MMSVMSGQRLHQTLHKINLQMNLIAHVNFRATDTACRAYGRI